jgi:septal ring factor EnvC (AmiA/AmiB activator)
LFLHGKRPVDVAVKLDLSASEINRIYQDFWKLKRLHKLTVVYKEIEPYLSSFLKLFKIIKKNSISELEIVNAIKYANELPHLQSEVQRLRDEVQDLEDKKDRCKADLLDLQVEISYSKNTLDRFQSVLDHKKQQIANMNEKLSWP